MKYKFRLMTTEEIKNTKTQIEEDLNKKMDELHKLKDEIAFLRRQRTRATDYLFTRARSPYNGEFYINSKTRKKYGKPVSQMTLEEKRQYNREYYKTHPKKRKHGDK